MSNEERMLEEYRVKLDEHFTRVMEQAAGSRACALMKEQAGGMWAASARMVLHYIAKEGKPAFGIQPKGSFRLFESVKTDWENLVVTFKPSKELALLLYGEDRRSEYSMDMLVKDADV